MCNHQRQSLSYSNRPSVRAGTLIGAHPYALTAGKVDSNFLRFGGILTTQFKRYPPSYNADFL